MALARTHRLADATKWLTESETFSSPGAGMFSLVAFRDAWFEAEAVILRDEVRKLLERDPPPSHSGADPVDPDSTL